MFVKELFFRDLATLLLPCMLTDTICKELRKLSHKTEDLKTMTKAAMLDNSMKVDGYNMYISLLPNRILSAHIYPQISSPEKDIKISSGHHFGYKKKKSLSSPDCKKYGHKSKKHIKHLHPKCVPFITLIKNVQKLIIKC